MKDEKIITVSVPENLMKEADELGINIANVTVSALERQIKLIKETEALKKGYEEMGEINLGLAELSLEAENEALLKAEHYLTECE